MMDEAKQPEPIESEPKESTASRIQRREAEIALAMKQAAERHAAVIKNMHRLRALRLSRTSKASAWGVLTARNQAEFIASANELLHCWGGVRHADL
jgi:hypothetical protein